MPKLSICIPLAADLPIAMKSECVTTVSALLAENGRDYEIVIVDATKDHRELQTFVNEQSDPKLKLEQIASKNARSKPELWSAALSFCEAEWITFIAADDFIDLEIVGLLERIEEEFPEADCLGWNKIEFDIPKFRNPIRSVKIPTDFDAFALESEKLTQRFFRFEREGLPPFSLYHGAIRRDLLERIKDRFGGVYFEHPLVEYEFGFKALCEANELFFCQRPISVIGHGAQANYLATEQAAQRKELWPNFLSCDLSDFAPKDFPFDAVLSPGLLTAATLRWFIDTYETDVDVSGWEREFVLRRTEECNALTSKEYFDELVEAYSSALSKWHGGKYMQFFTPKFGDRIKKEYHLVGHFDDYLFIDKAVSDSQSTAEFYNVIKHFLTALHSVGARFKSAA